MVREILLMHHSHFDLGYTHSQPVVWELQRRYIDEVIDCCEATADWPEPSQLRWTCEVAAPALHWLRSARDGEIDRFRRLMALGRISIGALPWHITPLCNAEEMTHCMQPLTELRERFGLSATTALQHDISGVPWPLTQWLLDAGVDFFVMGVHPVLGTFPLHRPLPFQWQAPDGRLLLTFNGEQYNWFSRVVPLLAPTLPAAQEGITKYLAGLEAAGYPLDFAFLTASNPVRGDNNPPYPPLMDLVRQWNDEGLQPVIRFATPEMLRDRIRALPAESLQQFRGDWTDYWNFGSGSAARELRVVREARTRLMAAELLFAHNGNLNAAPVFAQAWRNVIEFSEHTWGSRFGIQQPDADGVAEQWTHKAEMAYSAKSLAGMLVRDQLEAAAANPRFARGAQGVLVFNPAPVERREFLRVPSAWLDGGWRHDTFQVHTIEIARDLWTSPTTRFIGPTAVLATTRLVGPVTLAPSSLHALPLDQLRPAEPLPGCSAGTDRIESPYYRLDFDRATGRVRSITDKRTGQIVNDTQSPWPFFGFVRESLDPQTVAADDAFAGREIYRNVGFQESNDALWRERWRPGREQPTRLLSLDVANEIDGPALRCAWQAPGVIRLEQTIKLLALRPAVELTASMDKTDVRTPESIYFTFPLNVSGWRCHFDTVGVPVELDADQLPGTCRGWATVDQWVCIHNDHAAVTLACPDAPLVQVGGFNFGHPRHNPERANRALLLGWAANNYWYTNFRASQPGPIHVRYELTAESRFDAASSTRAALTAATPIEVHPLVQLQAPWQRSLKPRNT